MKAETLQQPRNTLSPELIFAIAELIRALHLAGIICFLLFYFRSLCSFVLLDFNIATTLDRQKKNQPINQVYRTH
ncbi:hypothetical protein PVK73_26815 [Bacillus thuringiensis]